MGEKNTVDVLFKRDTLENIRSTPLKDGQVLWTIDQEGNDKIYNDVKQSDDTIKRTQIGGTIQVDQDFDKESPYPLANKKIVNGLKDFIPAYAKDLDILTDALSISTTDENFELNKTQLVSWGTTANMPEDCLLGIRDVGRGKGNPTYVRIFGRDKYGIPTEWFNSWGGTNWTGWARAITRNDLYIGYDSLINNVQKSVKILKPSSESEDEVAVSIAKNNTSKVAITYAGNAFVHSVSINKDDGTSPIVIDHNGNFYGSLSQVSDKKAKTHIAYLKDENKLDEFYMNLKPVEYKWKDNGHRTHLGFYAQDIAENAKNTIGDISMYQAIQLAKDKNGKEIEKPYSPDVEDKDLKWTLSYDELIAPTVAMVQKQQKEIEELKQQIENLKR